MNNNLLTRLDGLLARFDEVSTLITDPAVIADMKRFVKLNKEYSDLEKIVAKRNDYKRLLDNLDEAKNILDHENDPELRDMAKAEIDDIEPRIPSMEEEIKLLLVPADPEDSKNCIVEIRGGTGGDEAAIFAGDLFRMYRGYCDRMGWKLTVQEASEGTVGGYKEIRVFIEGDSVYGTLKFESGVHRVQRVPDTETQGRVHTSAATVAILPEAEEVDVEIREADIHMDTYRSSGAGGQYINKTDSAVRLTHIPTGVVVSCQTERSQLQNRLHAMEMLRSKILDAVIAKKEQAEAASRKAMVGTGDRSAKIRTYNFPQNRVTDHRVNLTLYRLDSVMTGDIQEIVDALQMAHAQEVLGKFA